MKEFYGGSLLEILSRMRALQSINCSPGQESIMDIPLYPDITSGGLGYFGSRFSELVARELSHIREITISYEPVTWCRRYRPCQLRATASTNVMRSSSRNALFTLWLVSRALGPHESYEPYERPTTIMFWIAMQLRKRNEAWVPPPKISGFRITRSLHTEASNDYLHNHRVRRQLWDGHALLP